MGLEASLTVTRPGNCPIVDASVVSETPVELVAQGVQADRVVEEFEVGAGTPRLDGVEEVFDGDRSRVYRFERAADRECVCSLIESFGCPVANVRAVDGTLEVVFRPADLDTLRRIVRELRETFGDVRLDHLVRSGHRDGTEPVVVDRGRLTDRQREVLETAYRMGYFEYPRTANAEEVAATLEIASATFREHLAAAQSKLLQDLVEG